MAFCAESVFREYVDRELASGTVALKRYLLSPHRREIVTESRLCGVMSTYRDMKQ